jgi:hypothetical protein
MQCCCAQRDAKGVRGEGCESVRAMDLKEVMSLARHLEARRSAACSSRRRAPWRRRQQKLQRFWREMHRVSTHQKRFLMMRWRFLYRLNRGVRKREKNAKRRQMCERCADEGAGQAMFEFASKMVSFWSYALRGFTRLEVEGRYGSSV